MRRVQMFGLNLALLQLLWRKFAQMEFFIIGILS